MRNFGPIELLVVQPTPFCNIACSYCYLPDRSSRERMSDSTLAALFETVFSSPYLSERLTIVWHAGEPLAAGLDFYTKAFEAADRANRSGVAIQHNFQTNGLLIDSGWLKLFRRHSVGVGISLDGPKRFHDAHRVTRSRRGTHDRVMKAVHDLQNFGHPFHVISVLTQPSLSAGDEFFAFYVANGIQVVGFNVEEVEGVNRSSTVHAGAKSAVSAFFAALERRAVDNPGLLEIREFENARSAILFGEALEVDNPQTNPLSIVSVAANGDLSTFSPELLGFSSEAYGDFAFSNVHAGGIEEILRNPSFNAAYAAILRGTRVCKRTCEYFGVCQGGAPANKFFEHGVFSVGETDYCRNSKQAVVDVVLAGLERRCSV